jgi:hypothetical protein
MKSATRAPAENLCAAIQRAAEAALVLRQLAFQEGLKRASGGASGGAPSPSAEQRKRAVRAILLSTATRDIVFGRA